MNKTGEISISTLIFGIIMLALATSAGIYMLTEVVDNNPSITDQAQIAAFNKTFNKQTEIIANQNKLTNKINTTGIENVPGVGPIATAIQSTFEYIKTMFTSLEFIKDLFTDTNNFASTYLQIPSWVGLLIGSLIVFVIGFTILRMIFGEKP